KQTSELKIVRSGFATTALPPFFLAPASLGLLLICLRLSAVSRARLCARRSACTQARLAQALLHLPALVLASARAQRWPLPMRPPLRACLSAREQFARPSFSQDR